MSSPTVSLLNLLSNRFRNRYREIISLDPFGTEPLPFVGASYQGIINCIPPAYFNSFTDVSTLPSSTYESMLFKPFELLRYVSDDGFAVIGMSEEQWQEHDVLNTLMDSSSGSLSYHNINKPAQPFGAGSLPLEWSLLSVQKLDMYPEKDSVSAADVTEDNNMVAVPYYVAVLRKKR